MPKLETRNNPNVIKIEPSPTKKPTVKVKMQTLNMAGGSPKFITDESGKKTYQMSYKDPKNLTRLPGTVVEYSASLGKNGLNTGLDKNVDNPYSDLDFYRQGWEPILKGKKKVRLQELLEYKHNKPANYYTNQVSDIRSSYQMEEAPFYQRPESRISLRDGVTYLDLNNPIHEVNYYMLRSHKMVANSYEELKTNPDATHYIVDENEKVGRESASIRKINKVGACLEKLINMPDGTIQDFCKAMLVNKQDLNKEEAYSELDAVVKKSDERYDEFMDLYEMWDDPATREKFMAYVETAEFMSVPSLITVRNNKFFWTQPAGDGGKRELWEWKSKEDFINSFLLDPRYQDEVEILRAQYRSKTRF
jgi:hypothetical protein